MPARRIGVIGLGKMAMPIAELLVKGGHQVAGYRRSSMADFEAFGGIPKQSPAAVVTDCDFVISCLPSEQALDEVVAGPHGVMTAIRSGQIMLELGTYPLEVKERQRERLASKSAVFIDGEISGTPGMVAQRKSAVYLSGDEAACRQAAEVVKAFTDSCFYFGTFGSSIQVKLIANLLVTLNVTAIAEAMALALRTGIDPKRLIQAVGSGAGSSPQFLIRAPWMAERKFLPAQGGIEVLSHYFAPIKSMAARLGVATPMLDRAITLFERAMAEGLGEHDIAAMVDVIGNLPSSSHASVAPNGPANG
jgi:3-hydroxyisobutyrate dehydrogenase-like beta-hydroxyacid dehydrogenase